VFFLQNPSCIDQGHQLTWGKPFSMRKLVYCLFSISNM
jgi:hypothetical protein